MAMANDLFAKASLVRQVGDQKDLLIETDRAAVMKDTYPKAQYHFLVVSKEAIANVTALTQEHLPLLDHMMELANEIIERQQHLEPSNFRIGFKIDAYMHGLNMHVISDDFYSQSMRRIKHWNSFHTDLFLTYQAVYALLRTQGFVEQLPDGEAEKLREAVPLRCNQCDFSSESLVNLKSHLFQHWQKRERKREAQKQVDKLTSILKEIELDGEAGKKPNEVPQNASKSETSEKGKLMDWRREAGQQGTNAPFTAPYPNAFGKHFKTEPGKKGAGGAAAQHSPMQRYQNGMTGFQPFLPMPPPFNPFRQFPNPTQSIQVGPLQLNRFIPPHYQNQSNVGPNSNYSRTNWKPKDQSNTVNSNNWIKPASNWKPKYQQNQANNRDQNQSVQNKSKPTNKVPLQQSTKEGAPANQVQLPANKKKMG
ncbi:hypothetical protein KR222_002338 [Zaprionus bogoriensis]|nr:hypothetical protein KR222_002338 [Zaprionus bogoriensis]